MVYLFIAIIVKLPIHLKSTEIACNQQYCLEFALERFGGSDGVSADWSYVMSILGWRTPVVSISL